MGGGDMRAAVAMNLVSMFQHEADPFGACAHYINAMRGYSGGMGGGYGGMGMQQGSMKRPRENRPPAVGEKGNWGCPDCGNVNFAFRTECNKCNKARVV